MRLYRWIVSNLHCCGCFVGIVALPVLTAGTITAVAVMT
jgi:hypothetical protein